MENNRKMDVIIVLLILNLAFSVFTRGQFRDDVRDVRQEVNQIRNDMHYSINGIENDVVYSVERLLKEQNSKIQDITVNLIDFDANKREAVYQIEAQLKESPVDALVFWVISGDTTGFENRFTLTDEGNMTFKGETTLSIMDDYTTNIVLETVDGQTVLNDEKINIPLKREYLDNRIMHSGGSGSYGNKSFEDESIYELKIIDEELFGIQSVEALIYVNEELYEATDASDFIFFGESREEAREKLYASEHYKAFSSGSHNAYSEASEMAVPINTIENEGIKTTYMVAYFYGNFSDFDGVKDGNMIDVRYRVTFNDGYVYEPWK